MYNVNIRISVEQATKAPDALYVATLISETLNGAMHLPLRENGVTIHEFTVTEEDA